jgi:ribonuclease HI
MHQWYQTDWINAKGEHVKNKDLWKPLHALAKNHLIRVESVRAHNYSVWLRDEIRKREAAD